MQGQLTPEQQLRVLGKIWGYSRSGYVFVPWINGDCTTKEQRKKSFHEGRAYKWPKEKALILQHLKDHQNDELYFPPNMFEGKRRVEQFVAAEVVLYADLDDAPSADPHQLDHKPTIAWESSPGRYQGVWLMDRAKTGASWANQENHRLTVKIGADPSGWDSTQLLRVPGRPNFKPEYKDENGGQPVEGAGLLWDNGPRYVWNDFSNLPEVGSDAGESTDHIDETLLHGIDRHEVWARVRLKVPSRIREYLALKTLPVGADRSDVLWDISRELADVGCSALEIVAITRPSVWNKFANRPDELKLLLKGAAKAVAARSEESVEQADEVEDEKPGLNWLADVALQKIPKPRWLIKDVWTKGGLGFISGAPKSYKSWMALDMAISVATGSYFLNQPQFYVSNPKPVLYLQEEDDLRLVMERMALITESKVPDRFWHGQIEFTGECDDNNVPLSDSLTWAPPSSPIPIAMQVQTGFIASDPGWQAWLDDILMQDKFGMVIMDTLGTVAGEVDIDKSGELMTKILRPLRIIARKHDVAICVVHHNKKAANQGGRAGQDMLGSTALHAWVECAIYARSKDSRGEIQVEREAKLAMDMSFKVKIPMMFEDHKTGDRQLWDPELITEAMDDIHHEVPMSSVDNKPVIERGTGGKSIAFKLRHMGRGPFTFDDIMDRLGSDSPSSIRKQLQQGVDNGYLDEVDGKYTPLRD